MRPFLQRGRPTRSTHSLASVTNLAIQVDLHPWRSIKFNGGKARVSPKVSLIPKGNPKEKARASTVFPNPKDLKGMARTQKVREPVPVFQKMFAATAARLATGNATATSTSVTRAMEKCVLSRRVEEDNNNSQTPAASSSTTYVNNSKQQQNSVNVFSVAV